MDESLVAALVALVLVAASGALVALRRPGRRTAEPEREPEPERAAGETEAAAPPAAAPTGAASAPAVDRPAARHEADAAPAPAPEAPPPAAATPTPDEEVKRLRKGLASTRGGFVARLAKLLRGDEPLAPAQLDEIEEVLLQADLGVRTADRLLERLRARGDAGGDAWEALREEAHAILDTGAPPLRLDGAPSLVLVVGVNGVGKTTTIGKLAAKLTGDGRRVLLAAGDTFRAAAVPQLESWGRRVGVPVVTKPEGADPGSVVFDAVKRARDEGFDVVLADTAGRLHTKAPLMEELAKVGRSASKALGRPADEILLVLDATTGQNAVQQAKLFKEALEVSGLVLTKLDGTAKGGVVLGIVDEHRLPVRYVGIGERVEDLRDFDADSFVRALFGKDDDATLAA